MGCDYYVSGDDASFSISIRVWRDGTKVDTKKIVVDDLEDGDQIYLDRGDEGLVNDEYDERRVWAR